MLRSVPETLKHQYIMYHFDALAASNGVHGTHRSTIILTNTSLSFENSFQATNSRHNVKPYEEFYTFQKVWQLPLIKSTLQISDSKNEFMCFYVETCAALINIWMVSAAFTITFS